MLCLHFLLPTNSPAALDRNPRHYPDPHTLNPSRWDSNTAFDASLIFSQGPRTCIGRKFATTEWTCFLTMFLKDWKVEPVMHDSETREEWIESVLKPIWAITFTTGDIPLRIVRRNSKA